MNNGIGFLGFLALIFIGLKLAGLGVVAAWSWGAVLSPLWVPVALVLCVGLVWVLCAAGVKVWRR